jgi:hypothetical protein
LEVTVQLPTYRIAKALKVLFVVFDPSPKQVRITGESTNRTIPKGFYVRAVRVLNYILSWVRSHPGFLGNAPIFRTQPIKGVYPRPHIYLDRNQQ